MAKYEVCVMQILQAWPTMCKMAAAIATRACGEEVRAGSLAPRDIRIRSISAAFCLLAEPVTVSAVEAARAGPGASTCGLNEGRPGGRAGRVGWGWRRLLDI